MPARCLAIQHDQHAIIDVDAADLRPGLQWLAREFLGCHPGDGVHRPRAHDNESPVAVREHVG